MQALPQLKDASSTNSRTAARFSPSITLGHALGLLPTRHCCYELMGQDEVAQYFTQQNSYHIVIEARPHPDIVETTLYPVTDTARFPLSVLVKVNSAPALTVEIAR